MSRHLFLIAPLLAALGAASTPASWVFRPSYYSHEPGTGQRVAQFAANDPAYSRVGGEGYLQSVYRHNSTTLRGPRDADRMHMVETWGQGEYIRPYGEWEYPYRAGATPYGPWGNPQGPWTRPFDSWQNPYGLLRHNGQVYQVQPGPQGPLGPQWQPGPSGPPAPSAPVPIAPSPSPPRAAADGNLAPVQ